MIFEKESVAAERFPLFRMSDFHYLDTLLIEQLLQ